MEKAFKYRMYPNREQRILLAKMLITKLIVNTVFKLNCTHN